MYTIIYQSGVQRYTKRLLYAGFFGGSTSGGVFYSYIVLDGNPKIIGVGGCHFCSVFVLILFYFCSVLPLLKVLSITSYNMYCATLNVLNRMHICDR